MMKQIPGFPGYQVTDDGRVWSDKTSRWLRPGRHPFGHLHVSLWENNRQFIRKVHHLVLAAFVGPRPEGMECRHLNGNPADNRLENLKWGTHSENVLDSVRHGTANCLRSRRGAEAGNAKLTETQVRWIKFLYKNRLFNQTVLGELFGVTGTNIGYIVRGKTWGAAA